MAGYWPCSFLRVYGPRRREVEVHKHAKKERGQYPVMLTEEIWSRKGLLNGFRRNFSCGTRLNTAGSPERARIAPSSQSQRGI